MILANIIGKRKDIRTHHSKRKRKCAIRGCSKILSKYNMSKKCFACQQYFHVPPIYS